MDTSSTATTELATPRPRLWWAWMPIVVRSSSTSRYADAVADVGHGEPSAGVGDVDAGGAGRFHDAGVLRQHVRLGHVTHHQETGDVEAEVAGGADVLDGDVGPVQWVATRTEVTPRSAAARRSAIVPMPGSRSVVTLAEVTTSATAAIHSASLCAGSVGQVASGEAVPVGDLDGGDPRGVQRRGDGPGLPRGEAVRDGVHPVAKGDVLDVDSGHRSAPASGAPGLPHPRAAEVMMSRLPA